METKYSKGDRVELPGLPQPIEIDGFKHSGTVYIDTDGESWFCKYVDKNGSPVSPVVEDADGQVESLKRQLVEARSETADEVVRLLAAGSGRGTPAWGVYDGAGKLHRAFVDQYDADEDAAEHERVRPVRVIEETDETQAKCDHPAVKASSVFHWTCPECGYLVDTPNHELGCKPAQATETPEWHAGFNAAVEAKGMLEQAGEPEWSEPCDGSPACGCPSCEREFAPAVPDAPGVVTRDVELTVTEYAEISFDNGDVEFLDGPTDERLSNDTHFRTVAYGPWRPVPAQPSTEQKALEAIEAALKPFGIVLPSEALHDAAGAVRAAFPALGEDA